MSRRRKRPGARELHGILLLDKPLGMSSNKALQIALGTLRAVKGGHTGALDPLATGLLPLCFGEATKIAGDVLAGDVGRSHIEQMNAYPMQKRESIAMSVI